jgi:glyoxylase-like metal-dependent hydrolase (beta-lactamase superfamily II)
VTDEFETPWFEVRVVAPGVTRIAEGRHAEDVKSYLVEGTRDVAVIDTGLGVGDFRGLVRRLSDREPLVLQTHGHWDHFGASSQFARVLIHPSEAYALRRGFPNELYRWVMSGNNVERAALPPDFDPETAAIPAVEPTGELNDGDRIDLGGRALEVLHTPGHSPGGVSLLDREARLLFSGDVVNRGRMWLHLPRSDAAAWRASIQRLADLAPAIDAIYCAHGETPLDPALVPQMRDAFEQVWSGARRPNAHEDFDIGFPTPVKTDIFDFEGFGFYLATGRYGAAHETRIK